MNDTTPAAARRPWLLDVTLIALLSVPVFFFEVGKRPVTSILEERVAITAREMWRAGEWVLPTMNGERRLQKPPLAYWLVEAFASVRGAFDDVTLRLPFALLALGTALFTWRMGRILAGPRAGLLAAVVLLTSALFVKEGHMATADPAMLFCASGAWCFCLAARRTAAAGRRGLGAGLGFCFFLALGALAKGPVILVLCVLPFLVEAIAARSMAPLRALWSPWGITLFLVLSFSWPAVVVCRLAGDGHGWDAVHQWFLESFGKVLPSSGIEDGYRFQRHAGPWYFYFPRLFAAFGLWSPVLIVALVAQARRGAAARLPWLWFVVLVAFFSVISEKKSAYMLPLVVPGALLVSIILLEGYPRCRRSLRRAAGLLAALGCACFLLGIGGIVWVEPSSRLLARWIGEDAGLGWEVFAARPAWLVLLGLTVLAGLLLFWRLLGREDPRAPFLALGVSMAVAAALYTDLKLGIPPEDGDMRAAAKTARDLLPPTDPVHSLGSRASGAVGSLPGGLVFYLDRQVVLVDEKTPEKLMEVPRGAGLLMSERRLRAQLGDAVGAGVDARPLPRQNEELGGRLHGFVIRGLINPGAVGDRDRTYVLEKTAPPR